MMEEKFFDNAARNRFEYHAGGGITYANYRRQDGTLYIDHVEAPPALRGKGTAGKLMEHIAARAREEQLAIVPVCGYAASWLRRHNP